MTRSILINMKSIIKDKCIKNIIFGYSLTIDELDQGLIIFELVLIVFEESTLK